MPTSDSEIRSALHTYFKLDSFREPQAEIIQSILNHSDVLALLPTGAGKSLCYQLPACLLPGITIVVSPLLSLMNDQVRKLKHHGIPATALTSQKSTRQQACIRMALKLKKLKILYLSPEKLLNRSWQSLLIKLSISLFVIDEAHCIEMWGDEFRPAYLDIKKFLSAIAQRPCIAAFTATATQSTAKQIIRTLGLRTPKCFQLSTRKSHLQIIVQACQSQAEKLTTLLSYLQKPNSIPAIIYCTTQQATAELAECLPHFTSAFTNYTITAYHGGLISEQRIAIEQQFITNKIDILVATNAFGMGVDKPNTRTVIHWQVPASIENFYQEIGRAGRDQKPAVSILCFCRNDLQIQAQLCNTKHAFSKRAQQKLHSFIQLLNRRQCLNQQLERYFNDPHTLSPCGHCSVCKPTQPLTQSQFQLFVWLTRITTSQYRTPTPNSTITLLTVIQPINYKQLLTIPGIGLGWLKCYCSSVITICRVYRLPRLLIITVSP